MACMKLAGPLELLYQQHKPFIRCYSKWRMSKLKTRYPYQNASFLWWRYLVSRIIDNDYWKGVVCECCVHDTKYYNNFICEWIIQILSGFRTWGELHRRWWHWFMEQYIPKSCFWPKSRLKTYNNGLLYVMSSSNNNKYQMEWIMRAGTSII